MTLERAAIIDDDPNFIFILERMLKREFPALSLSTFTHPCDAFHSITACRTDLVITNHGTGTMTGTQLVSRVRAIKPELPIIMVSDNDLIEGEAQTAGVNRFLEKTKVDQLPTLIRGLLY